MRKRSEKLAKVTNWHALIAIETPATSVNNNGILELCAVAHKKVAIDSIFADQMLEDALTVELEFKKMVVVHTWYVVDVDMTFAGHAWAKKASVKYVVYHTVRVLSSLFVSQLPWQS